MSQLAKVFQNGRSQAIRLPKEYRVDGSEVYIEKIGHSIIIIQKEKSKWDVMRKALADLDELDFDRNQPKVQTRDLFWYMLDTKIVSYVIKNRDFSLIDKFEEMSADSTISVSSITVAELFYGVKKKQSKKLEVAVREFLLPLEKLCFDENAALHYGEIRTLLELDGKVIGSHDMLIAAHAKSVDAVLVTNNTKEFERVQGLKIGYMNKKKNK